MSSINSVKMTGGHAEFVPAVFREHVSARNKGALQGNCWIDHDVFNANHSRLVVAASNGNSRLRRLAHVHTTFLPAQDVISHPDSERELVLRASLGVEAREPSDELIRRSVDR
jgi:hypothetical protein